MFFRFGHIFIVVLVLLMSAGLLAGCSAGSAGTYVAATPETRPAADSDRDTVADAVDECSGTPSGVAVDAFGCPVTLYVKLSIPHAGGVPASPQEYAQQLQRLAMIMRDNPHARLRIEGHSSPGVSMEAEQALSFKWADNVQRDLQNLYGIGSSRMEVAGYGSAQPLVPNTTLEGRRRNQRLELTLHGYYSSLEAPETEQNSPESAAAVERPLPVERLKPTPPMMPAPSSLRFAYGGTELVNQDREQLETLGAYLLRHPDTRVHLAGHTDSKGSAGFNLELSRRRAEQIKQMLVQRFSIDASRISTEGKGESAPIASNDTEEGRLANRRVSITVRRGGEQAPAILQQAQKPQEEPQQVAALSSPQTSREIPRVRPASQPTPLDPGKDYLIKVSLKQCKLWLYERQPGGGEKLVRSYDVATPKPGVSGPQGIGYVTRIDFNPWWIPTENLKRAALRKGRRLPNRVRPGSSSNPMGKFKIHLSHGDALRIHGTNQPGLIGQRVSAGCIRMRNEQGLEMAHVIDEGTAVMVLD